MTTIFFLGQALGIITLLMGLYALTHQQDKRFFKWNKTTAFLDGVHWFLLQGYTGAISAFLVGIRVYFAERHYHSSFKIKRGYFLFFCFIFSVALLMTWQDYYSLLPWVAALVATYAYFFKKDLSLRIALLPTSTFWIVYALHIGSVGGVLSNVLTISVNSYTIYKMRKKLFLP